MTEFRIFAVTFRSWLIIRDEIVDDPLIAIVIGERLNKLNLNVTVWTRQECEEWEEKQEWVRAADLEVWDYVMPTVFEAGRASTRPPPQGSK